MLSVGCLLLTPSGAQVHNGYFVDLFVRKSNSVAINMYEKFGYIKYREVGAGCCHSDPEEGRGLSMGWGRPARGVALAAA